MASSHRFEDAVNTSQSMRMLCSVFTATAVLLMLHHPAKTLRRRILCEENRCTTPHRFPCSQQSRRTSHRSARELPWGFPGGLQMCLIHKERYRLQLLLGRLPCAIFDMHSPEYSEVDLPTSRGS